MADLKARIAKRCAKEFEDGAFVNLGIGLPTMVADYIPEGITVTLHSENGFAGLAGMAEKGKEDVDIINSGGAYVTTVPWVKYFDTSMSFGMARGHLDATVLGAMEVAENGDLANWIVPGKKVAGMGGAMLAMVACGAYPDVQTVCSRLVHIRSTMNPTPELAAKYERRYQAFKQIYPACKGLFAELVKE